MMTVVTTTRLRPGDAAGWDAAMRARFDPARERPGWVAGQLLTADDENSTRLIVGTWRSREDWEAWDSVPALLAQQTTLERLEAEPSRSEWFQVVADARAADRG